MDGLNRNKIEIIKSIKSIYRNHKARILYENENQQNLCMYIVYEYLMHSVRCDQMGSFKKFELAV